MVTPNGAVVTRRVGGRDLGATGFSLVQKDKKVLVYKICSCWKICILAYLNLCESFKILFLGYNFVNVN